MSLKISPCSRLYV